jgi:hypothetical protein
LKNNLIIDYIIQQLLEVQHGKLWMGDTFDKKISSITEKEAFTRPLPNLHSPAELISHLTAWRKDTLLKIRDGKGQLTDNSDHNWPGNDELKKIGWSQIIQNYRDSLIELVGLLRDKEDSFLDELYEDQDYKGKYAYSFVINGLLHHDLYHLGQLGIVIKLIKES